MLPLPIAAPPPSTARRSARYACIALHILRPTEQLALHEQLAHARPLPVALDLLGLLLAARVLAPGCGQPSRRAADSPR
jgi:hypothetical protein